MLFSVAAITLFLTQLDAATEREILAKVPNDWYQSTTQLFDYCAAVKFNHPICPEVNLGNFSQINWESDFFKAPVGPLTAKTLFQATVLYQVKRPPDFWFVSLQLDKPRPQTVEPRLWAEAQWLWGRILFDQRKYKEALYFFDQVVDAFKGRALFHQQRAWVQYFNKLFDQALGSIVSAESPLIYPVPFPEKFFLRALIEKEMCHYQEAVNTLNAGRDAIKKQDFQGETHPWVLLCARKNLGATCSRMENWYRNLHDQKRSGSMRDLDLLEVELKDRLTAGQKEKSKSFVMWPKKEAWRDELGRYSVPIDNRCGS